MTSIAVASALDPAPISQPEGGVPACKPWNEMARAALYVVLAGIVGFVAGTAYAMAAYAIRRKAGWPVYPPRIDFVWFFGLAAQLVVIPLTIARGRRLGGGNLILGLAAGPILKFRLFRTIVLLELLLAAFSAARLVSSPTFSAELVRAIDPELLTAVHHGPALVIAVLFSLMVLSPISEELFFRGWLWTALRRSWNVRPTALVTSAAWLALHLPMGVSRVVHLLPLAVALALLRHRTGSVRATIAIHFLNNARAFLLPLAALGWF